MREFEHTVRSVVGLHPRVAGVMMHLVKDFESDVILTDGEICMCIIPGSMD